MKFRLSMYTLMHFLVDLTCIYRIYALVMPQSINWTNWVMLVVLYNFLAFALPGLVGLIADLADTSDFMAALGCILTAVPLFMPRHVLAVVVLQGVGNGLFHVGAGRRVLQDSRGKFAHSGIFISSGAMGVFRGTFWKNHYRPAIMQGLSFAVAVCAGILLIFYLMQKKEKDTSGSVSDGSGACEKQRFFTVPALMILLVVILRSFYGHAVSYDWKNTALLSFLFVLCVVAGKAAGGILADLVGVRKTAVLSLGGAALTVLFSADSPLLGCISIMLFNMTMPLTLALLAHHWRNYPGSAFGILMTALFIGTLPDVILGGVFLPMWALCITALLSLICLLMGTGREESREK